MLDDVTFLSVTGVIILITEDDVILSITEDDVILSITEDEVILSITEDDGSTFCILYTKSGYLDYNIVV